MVINKEISYEEDNGFQRETKYFYNRITTTDGILTTIDSIFIPEGKSYRFTITVNAYQSDFSRNNVGDVIANFSRAVGGNVTKQGSLINTLVGAMSGASLTMVANTGTQSVDLKISGIILTTIIWEIKLKMEYNI